MPRKSTIIRMSVTYSLITHIQGVADSSCDSASVKANPDRCRTPYLTISTPGARHKADRKDGKAEELARTYQEIVEEDVQRRDDEQDVRRHLHEILRLQIPVRQGSAFPAPAQDKQCRSAQLHTS